MSNPVDWLRSLFRPPAAAERPGDTGTPDPGPSASATGTAAAGGTAADGAAKAPADDAPVQPKTAASPAPAPAAGKAARAAEETAPGATAAATGGSSQATAGAPAAPPPPNPASPVPPSDPPASAAAKGAEPRPVSRGDDVQDAYMLPFVLLYRSRMHTIDLRRLLAAMGAGYGIVGLTPGAVRSRAMYRHEIQVQVAIEMVLEGSAFQTRLLREPEFLRVAHDAMYWLADEWTEAPGQEVDLRDHAEERFGAWLDARMNDPHDAHSQPGAGGGRVGVGVEDRRFLFARVRELAELLAEPPLYKTRFETEWRGHRAPPEGEVTQVLRDTLRLEEAGPPRLLERMATHQYRWRFSPSGESHTDASAVADASEPQPAWAPDARFIRAFARVIADMGPSPPAPVLDFGTLSAELGILRASPAWPTVREALDRLEEAEKAGAEHPERVQYAQMVHDFAALLRKSAATLADALVCGAAVGGLAGGDDPGEKMLQGLRTMAAAYRFLAAPQDEVAAHLARLKNELRVDLKLLPASPPEASPLQAVRAWGAAVRKAMVENAVAAAASDQKRIHDLAWASARERVAAYTSTGTAPEPHAAELLLAVAGESPSGLLRFDLSAMRLAEWSEVAYRGLVSFPDWFWMGLAALAPLGIQVQDWHGLVKWLRERGWPGPAPGEVPLERLPPAVPDPAPRPPVVVVIRRASGSMVGDWLPSPSTPAVALTADQASTVMGAVRKGNTPPPLAPRVGTVAFEMPMDEPGSDERLIRACRKLPPEIGKPIRFTYFYAQPPAEGARQPHVVAPRSAAELAPEAQPRLA